MWLCVTFKFVCFYGIKGKKRLDEVERERERERELWYVLEFGGSGREKKGKSKGTCVEEKKEGKRRRNWIKKIKK